MTRRQCDGWKKAIYLFKVLKQARRYIKHKTGMSIVIDYTVKLLVTSYSVMAVISEDQLTPTSPRNILWSYK